MELQQELPKYTSNRERWALHIKKIIQNTDGSALLVPEEDGYSPVFVSEAYMTKNSPHIGGVYILYGDGYQAFCPADVFAKHNQRVN